MSLFFVLSGFVIHYNYRTSVTTQGWSGVAAFIWARFSRLYPLFLLILFADMLLGKHLWSAPPEQLDSVLRALPYYFLSVQSWVYEPIRTHSLIYAIGTVVPVTWSISTEWFFYLAFPVIAPLVLFLRRSTSAVIATIVWCFVWGYFATTVYDHINSIESWAVVKYGPIASAQVGPAHRPGRRHLAHRRPPRGRPQGPQGRRRRGPVLLAIHSRTRPQRGVDEALAELLRRELIQERPALQPGRPRLRLRPCPHPRSRLPRNPPP